MESKLTVKKKIIKLGTMFVLGVMVGFVLIIAVNALPTDGIKRNLKESVDVIVTEGYAYPIIQSKAACLDNFTEALVMSGCAYESNQSVIKKAMNVPVLMGSPIRYLNDYLNDKEVEFHNYARYWHGYQVILKPAYSVFNYQQMRNINYVFQGIVLVVLIYFLIKQKKFISLIAFLIAYFSIQPIAIGANLHFSWVVYIAMIASIVILKNKSKQEWTPEGVMLISGMCTSYMDLISAPLITLGIPLFFILDDEEHGKWKLKELLINSFVWCVGYAGMWISKWIIGSAILGRNVFKEALETAKYRSGNKDGWWELLAYEVVEENWKLIPAAQIVTIAVFVMLFVFIFFRKDGVKVVNKQYIILSLYPIIWILCMQNHSWVHFYFTYRILSILVVSLGCFLFSNLYYNRKQLKNGLLGNKTKQARENN